MIEKQAANGDRLTLGYDGANRLVQLTRASERGRTVDATYRYDGLGRRISKAVRHENGTTATTHYGWDGDRLVREESENQHSTIVYEPGSFVPMLRIDGTQEGQLVSAFVTDAIGTPMQLVAANGETQWQGQPDDWAAVKTCAAVPVSRFGSRGNGRTRRVGSTTTGIVTMTRRRDGILVKIRLGCGVGPTCMGMWRIRWRWWIRWG